MYNTITIIGRLGQEPQFFGENAANISVATTESFKKDGAWEKETTWHDVKLWKVTDYQRNNLHKGTTVFITGTLKKDSYTDKAGVKRNTAYISARKVIILENEHQHRELNTAEITESSKNTNEDLPF